MVYRTFREKLIKAGESAVYLATVLGSGLYDLFTNKLDSRDGALREMRDWLAVLPEDIEIDWGITDRLEREWWRKWLAGEIPVAKKVGEK